MKHCLYPNFIIDVRLFVLIKNYVINSKLYDDLTVMYTFFVRATDKNYMYSLISINLKRS